MSLPAPCPLPQRPSNASEMFALQAGLKCEGPETCHWCGAPCKARWPHGEPPPLPYRKTPATHALYPSAPWICAGCWAYRRTRVTVPHISSGFRDKQCFMEWSWILTPQACHGIRLDHDLDRKRLLELLQKPPLQFALALLSGLGINHIQQAKVNWHAEVRSDTVLAYTLDGSPHTFSVYELTEGAKSGFDGKSGGTAVLARLLHAEPQSDPISFPPAPDKRGRGRPAKGDEQPLPGEVIRKSG